MGGPIAQDLLPLPRHGVFSARASHEARVAILAKAGCRRGCLVHGSLPMPILIPFGHLPARFLRAPVASLCLRSLAPSSHLLHPLSRSRSVPTPRQVPRSRSQESFRRRTMLDVIPIRRSEIRLHSARQIYFENIYFSFRFAQTCLRRQLVSVDLFWNRFSLRSI